MALEAVEKAVATCRFILKKRKRLIDDMGRKAEISENQKIYIGDELQLIKSVETLIKQCELKASEFLGKVPPQSIDLEEAVLGCLMLESVIAKTTDGYLASRIEIKKALSILEPRHFHVKQNELVFEAIQNLWRNDNPIDMRTVVEKLRKMGTLEEVGGAYRIAELTSKVSSGSNVEYHSRILIEMAVKRELIAVSGKVIHEAYMETSDALELLDFANDQIKTINEWIR